MSHEADPWSEVLHTAITKALEGRHEAVPGARLRKFVERAAAERGLAFPPKGEHAFRFGEFLDRYGSVLAIRKRPGQVHTVSLTFPSVNTQSQSKAPASRQPHKI